jgi:predicted Zn finger-like uncharacterized protein
MFTVCPKCALTLVVTAADLRVAQGYVRCGRCSSVFNALAQLSDDRGAARDAETTSPEAEPSAEPASAAEPEPQESARAPTEAAGQSESESAPPPAAAEEESALDIDVEFNPRATDTAAGHGRSEPQSAPPPVPEEESIPDIELEFNPATTDAASVFVAVAPSPEWTAATGSFKALVAANQAPVASEPQPPAQKLPAQADEDIEVELDTALLSDIVQSEAGPAPPSAAHPAPREVAPPSPPPESAPPPPRQPAPPAPRETAGPTPRQPAPAAAPKPTAPAPAPPREQHADRKRPTPITPIAPAGAAKIAAPASSAAPAKPAPPPAPPAPTAPKVPPGPTKPAAPATAATATTPKVATEPARSPAASEPTPDDSDAADAGGFGLLEAAAKLRPAPGTRRWAAGAALLALVLVAQIIDHHRDALATDPRFSRALTALYSALGVALTPRWDLRAYDVRQLGATVGQGSLGAITVRASIRNTAPTPQPLPMLRVTLQDRFGNRLASRDVLPRDYLPQSIAPAALLSRDQRIDAELAFVDPGANAVGFELDACLPVRSVVACANDASAR